MLVAPLVAHAQQPGKKYRVGFVVTTTPMSELVGDEPIHFHLREFLAGLRAQGWAEGQNLIVERRTAEGDSSASATSCVNWSVSRVT
jgi:hypothetical protein